MGGNTKIEWCHHSFNCWTGCSAISPACDHCYAKTLVERWGGDFGERRRTSTANWKKPLAWNKKAVAAGVRLRVFCASLADVFDNQVPTEWRDDLWALIAATPNLDWLLLTKRPQNIVKMLPATWGYGWDNVWLGTTAENEHFYHQRWAHLGEIPARIRFISYEPALGPLGKLALGDLPLPDWIICGAESGHGFREMPAAWADETQIRCREAGIAFFMKQMSGPGGRAIKDIAKFPPSLQVREFPR